MRTKSLFFALFLMAAIGDANGRVLYVDAKARDASDGCGLDNGSGTISNPWASLHYATKKLRPGDTLYIRGGEYREDFKAWDKNCLAGNDNHVVALINNLRATKAAPVLIRPYKNEAIVIQSSPLAFDDTNNEWKPCESTSKCGSCTGLKLSPTQKASIYYRNDNYGSSPRVQIYVDPVLITEGNPRPGKRLGYNGQTGPVEWGSWDTKCADINKLKPGTFSAVGSRDGNQTTVYLPDGSDPDKHKLIVASEVGATAPHVIGIFNSSYVRFSGQGDDGQSKIQILGGYYTLYVDRSSNIEMDHMFVHNSGSNEYGSAVRTGSGNRNLHFHHLDVEDVTAEGISLYAGGNSSCTNGNIGVIIEHCRVVRTGQDIIGMKGYAATLGDGIFGKGSENVIVQYNYVENTTRDGITVSPSGSCQSNKWIIRGNEVVNACNDPRGSECAGIALKQHSVKGNSTSRGHIVENNLIHSISGRPGATAVQGIRQTGYSGSYGNYVIRYNTIDVTKATGAGIYFDGKPTVLPCDVIGNLILGNSKAPGVWVRDGNAKNAIRSHQYNTYWMPTASALAFRLGFGSGVTRGSVVAKYESSAMQKAPIFAGKYRLAAISPQVNKGGNACKDRGVYGTQRPVGGTCDIGASEYTSTPTMNRRPAGNPTAQNAFAFRVQRHSGGNIAFACQLDSKVAPRLFLYDVGGKLVRDLTSYLHVSTFDSQGTGGKRWNTKGIPSGIYFVRLLIQDAAYAWRLPIVQ